MTIQEMHVMFRQYSQQMGMQNVRAILPEQIDLLINNSINDTINQIVTQNIGVTNDRVITDNSKLNQVNALKSLYKVWKGKIVLPKSKTSYIASYNIPISSFGEVTNIQTATNAEYAKEIDGKPDTKCNWVDVGEESLKDGDTIYSKNDIVAYATKTFKNHDNTGYIKIIVNPIQYIYIVDLSIDYKKNNFNTNIFPIRIVDDMYLADVVNDFILRPTFRSPVATIHDNNIELYIDKPDDRLKESYTFGSDLIPNDIRLSYIAKPASVKFLDDVGGDSVNCDLPEYLHVDIVKHAVELYRTAVTGSIAVTQQAQEAQQRENLKNNYRQGDNDNSNR